MTQLSQPEPPAVEASLRTLTGVRSGKNSYYVELRRTEERMTSAVRALEGISGALVRTRDDPRALLYGVLRAAAGHLRADWTMVALRDGAMPGLGLRFLAVGRTGAAVDSELALPASLREQIYQIQSDDSPPRSQQDGWVRVPMMLDGQMLGRLVVAHPPEDEVDPEDLWVLRILASQAAVAMQTATLHTTAVDLRVRAQQLYDEVAESAANLESRTQELEHAQGQLHVLHQRELLDAERHRIALELHDSVAQYVLSAGLAVDVCRLEAVERDGADAEAVRRLVHARDLVADAGDQVRSVIYALQHEPAGTSPAPLSQLLADLAAQHRPTLAVTVHVVGAPTPLGVKTEHALLRVAGEALFNVSIHARARRAAVRLRYHAQGVNLSISDDGQGDPRELRRRLRLSSRARADGRHQGLLNMSNRAQEVGGSLAIRRARLGGIRIDASVPHHTEIQGESP